MINRTDANEPVYIISVGTIYHGRDWYLLVLIYLHALYGLFYPCTSSIAILNLDSFFA